MRKVVLYIAVSLDGYIADQMGGVDWLEGTDPTYKGDYGYQDFVQTVDTVVMGYTTYHQIRTKLSPDEWVYRDMTSYVLTHRSEPDTPDIHFCSGPLEMVLDRLRREPGKDIWLCGGADLARQAMDAGEIDEYRLTIMPILLGSGTRLFSQGVPEQKLNLSSVHTENGVINCTYQKR